MFKKLIFIATIVLILTGCNTQNIMKKYIIEEKDTEVNAQIVEVNDKITEVNNQTTEVNDKTTEVNDQTIEASDQTTEDNTEDIESMEGCATILDEDEFKVFVNGITIEVGDDPKEMIDTLENDPDSMECNFIFVGYDDELENEYYCRLYEGFSVYTKVNIVSGESIISQINISTTNRGIKIGDSYKDLIEKYGIPSVELKEGIKNCVLLLKMT
jgi:uncharacterized lipoprotein YehR (DUF1307 family)